MTQNDETQSPRTTLTPPGLAFRGAFVRLVRPPGNPDGEQAGC